MFMVLCKAFFFIYISCLEFNPRNNLIKLYQKVQSLKFIDFPIYCTVKVHFVFYLGAIQIWCHTNLTHSKCHKGGFTPPLVGWCHLKRSILRSHHEMLKQARSWVKLFIHHKMMGATPVKSIEHQEGKHALSDVSHVNCLQWHYPIQGNLIKGKAHLALKNWKTCLETKGKTA